MDRDVNMRLSDADAAAVDAVLDRDVAGEVDSVRRERVQAWLKVLGAGEEPVAPGDLAERTMAAVEGERMKFRRPAETTRAPSRWRRRLAEWGAMSVAAMLFLAVTVEALGQMKKSKARVACQANLMTVGKGFDAYAEGHNEELPMVALASNRNWLHGNGDTGAHNNAAHLLPLVDDGLVPLKAFYCAGAGVPEGALATSKNEMPAIGYSYRNMYGSDRPMWDRGHETMVLVDKNPVFSDGARVGAQEKNSPNHDGHGQYVLRADMSVTWETRPNIGPAGDNIWTVGWGKNQVLTYNGTEVPASLLDVFVCP